VGSPPAVRGRAGAPGWGESFSSTAVAALCSPAAVPPAALNNARRLLCALKDHLLAALVAARTRGGRDFARVAGVTAADTIYRVDRIGEAAILDWFGRY